MLPLGRVVDAATNLIPRRRESGGEKKREARRGGVDAFLVFRGLRNIAKLAAVGVDKARYVNPMRCGICSNLSCGLRQPTSKRKMREFFLRSTDKSNAYSQGK